jgi:selenocysteine lyase/cysteine desulfurase
MDPVALRAQFPVLAERAYLNSGTFGPFPQAALDAQTELLGRLTIEGRSSAYFELWGDLRTRLRAAYASVLNADPADVALTTGTSDGLVRVLTGIGLQPGDEILTAEREHPGLLGPLGAVRRNLGVTVRTVPLADIADAVDERTRLVACSHVAWTSGAVAPAMPDGVVVLLDGAQSFGAVPVDIGTLRCDFFAGPGQKWMCGPDGTGVLWIDPAWQERLTALGPTYVNLAVPGDGIDARPATDESRHDAPAIAAESWAAALAAHDVLADAGWDDVFARGAALAVTLAEMLANAGRTVAPRGPSTLVSWEEPDPPAVRERLATAGIVIRDLPGTPYVRASTGAWNSQDDLARLIAALG